LSADEQIVVVEDDGGVRTITINRPAARNSVNEAVASAIETAIDGLDSDPSLSIGIITGAGGYFCSGMDLKAFLKGEHPSTKKRGFAGLVEKPSEKPLIAAIEGFALAGGFEIALACDMIVSASDAFFALPEVKRGLVAAGGGLLRLPSRIPYNVAMQLGLTGGTLSAEDAHRYGLVNVLADKGGALAAAQELAATISANGPLAVRATKQVITQSRWWPNDVAFERQRELTDPIRRSKDAREGALAFTEKRVPVWRNE
jgi:enoyl-CoA hydratase